MKEEIDKLLKEGYKIYNMKNGKKYISKGCPCCSNDKFEIVELK